MISLSERLFLIAKNINKNDIVCDIGTDHAYVLIYLAQNNFIKKGYACDISEKSLNNAIKNIYKYKLQKLIFPILTDGLNKINNFLINTCIISGLGTKKMLNILSKDNFNIFRYILCSNDNFYSIRNWIKLKKYYIENEFIIKENNIFYELIIINKKNGFKVKNEKDIFFGPILRKSDNFIFIEKLNYKKKYYLKILNKIPINSTKYYFFKKKLFLINKIIK